MKTLFQFFPLENPDASKGMHFGAHPLIFKKAEELRNRITGSEELLWEYLKTNEWNLKFRRQDPLSLYVVDFYCHSLKLVIEVDGSIHDKEDVNETMQKEKKSEKARITYPSI